MSSVGGLSRRRFLQVTSATTTALVMGAPRWGWAIEHSPFGSLQDDPLLRLPEGFSYKVIAETGDLLEGGRGPATRPHFPDLNVVFPMPDGKLLLSTSHEIPAEFPVAQPSPREEYDRLATGAITSLLLRPDLTIAGSAYNAGGMVSNCSGGKTPWKTVLTGEEATNTLEADHGFIWEVDPLGDTKVRLDACGRFEHESAIVDPATGYVYLTEDSGGDSLLYRMRPSRPGRLAAGGVLEAYRIPGRWKRIEDPLGKDGLEPSAQGIAKGALKFARLEGIARRRRWLYFTETEDDTACGKVWRLHLDRGRLELWAQGSEGGQMCMPDNIVFDAAGNMFACEDKGAAGGDNPNKILFIDRRSGSMATFAEVVVQQNTPVVNVADEPTGPAFDPQRKILFLNLQRADGGGKTLAITGPFARPPAQGSRAQANVLPRGAQSEETLSLREDPDLWRSRGMTLGEAGAMVSLRRRGRIAELSPDLEALAIALPPVSPVAAPRRRVPKSF